MATIAELKKDYSYDPNDFKWIWKGGEIFEYLGMEVMRLDFKRVGEKHENPEDDKWENKMGKALLISAGEVDPMTESYLLKWKDVDYSKPEEEWELHETRIVPPGFSYGDPSESGEMVRFLPFSMHAEKMETEAYFAKLGFIFNAPAEKFPPMSFFSIQNLAQSKERERILKHVYNIVCVLKPEGEEDIIAFRVGDIDLAHQFKNTYKLNIEDVAKKHKLYLILTVDDDNYGCKISMVNHGTKKSLAEVKFYDLRKIFAVSENPNALPLSTSPETEETKE